MRFVGEGLAVAEPPAPVDITALTRAAVRQAQSHIGTVPNLAFVFVAADSPEAVTQAFTTVADLLPRTPTVGTSTSGVMAGGAGSESGTAVAVWVANLPGLRARGFHLDVVADAEGHHVVGLPVRRRDDVLGVLFTDPWSFPTTDFISSAEDLLHGLPVVGAITSSRSPGDTTRFLVDGVVHQSGAVGVIVSGPFQAVTAVSPACRPVGPVLTVTDSEGFLLRSLAGTPAVLRAQEVVAGLEEPDRSLALRGLCIGAAVSQAAEDPNTGDFVVQEVRQAEGERGALLMASPLEVGTAVQFHVRDQQAAEEDLSVLLEGINARLGDTLAGALLFTSAARGQHLFGVPNHDCALARHRLDAPVAGFYTDGEIAPLRGQMRVHQQTATVVVFAAGSRAHPGHSETARPRRIDTDPAHDELDRMLEQLSGPTDDDR